MKRFLAVFTGSEEARARSGWDGLDDAEREARQKKGVAAWAAWMEQHSQVVVDSGGPLGKTKRVSPRGIEDTSNNLAAYVVVEADSHEAAASMFEQHPHFSIFPGDSVEVMECLPVPQA